MKRFSAFLGNNKESRDFIGEFNELTEAVNFTMQHIADRREEEEEDETLMQERRLLGKNVRTWEQFDALIYDNVIKQAAWRNGKYLVK